MRKANITSSFSLPAAALLCLFGAILSAGCSGSGDTEGDEPIDSDQAQNDDSAELPQQEQDLPIDSGNAAGGTMLDLSSLLETEACSGGWIDDEGATPNCNALFRGVCFESDEAACTCAGCGDDLCIIAESFPTQISCDMQGFVD